MAEENKEGQPNRVLGALDKFEPGRASGPIENRNDYEERLRELPPDEKKLAEESTRLADLCQYFSRQHIDIPCELLSQVAGLSKLTISERVRTLVCLNLSLMEYLNGLDQNPAIRQ
jgi:hypothetical protein